MKRINTEYLKDKEKEEHLLAEYEKVMRHQGKIKETQSYRKAIEAEDWQEILKEKQKLERMIREYQKKQDMLIKEQNPEVLENIREEVRKKMSMQEAVVVQVAAPKVKLDAKEMGNQYLQYAKKLKEMPKEKPKTRMMDINLKCIDYEGEMMNKIARNTGDLSKIKVDMAPVTVQSGKFAQNASIKLPMFEMKEDDETKKYLSEIRSNLKELERSKKNSKEKPLLNSIPESKAKV